MSFPRRYHCFSPFFLYFSKRRRDFEALACRKFESPKFFSIKMRNLRRPRLGQEATLMMLELQSEYRIDADQASSSVIEDPSKIRNCSSSELAIWLRDDRAHLVLLDCRPTSESTTTFAGAQKILLPTVLMRRLQNGTLSPGSLAPQLAEQTQQIRVIIIPDRCAKSVMASKVYDMLNKRGFDVVCFDEEPEDFARHFPSLVESTNFTAPRKKGGLNLCLLANKFSENVIKPSADRGFPAKIFHCVYLGNDETAKNKELLKSFGISYVINVTSDLPNYYEADPDFHYLRIPVDDSHSHNLAKYFPDAISFIEKARSENTSVLVHCMAGISRSVTVCLAYLMYVMQCSLDDAFDRLLHQNASIQPNFHFMESLLCWEREIRKEMHAYVDENSTMPSSNSSAASSTCSSA